MHSDPHRLVLDLADEIEIVLKKNEDILSFQDTLQKRGNH